MRELKHDSIAFRQRGMTLIGRFVRPGRDPADVMERAENKSCDASAVSAALAVTPARISSHTGR